MKKLLVFSILILFTFSVQAQWYYKYGVTNVDELTENQLKIALQQTTKRTHVGATLTFIGAGMVIGGVALFNNATHDNDTGDAIGKGFSGASLYSFGFISMAVGIPIWIVNGNRKSSIELALVKFNTSSYLGNNSSENLGFKQPPNLGLSVKINF
ncbi:hypothetical protein [Maribellus sediminis]|uniref:hypothetical protein n=1 Tax=Maribellus sediminis TaxID=2696285 RepID=UPI001431D847|nr:hypothetical protein [Maribellus sediminis]